MNGNLEFRRGQIVNTGEMAVWVGAALSDPEAAIGPKTALGNSRLQLITGLQRVSATAVRRVIDVIRDAPDDLQTGLGLYVSGFPDDMLEQLGGIPAERAEVYLKNELDAVTRSRRINGIARKVVNGPDFGDPEDVDTLGSDSAGSEQLNGSNVSSDSVHDWLKNIGKEPLLTAEQEVHLSRRIEAGLAARAALERWIGFETTLETMTDKYQDLGYEELIQALEDVARDGEEAKQHLVTANLRLVVSIAKRYERSGLPFADRIQEGNIGLIRAVEKFDYKKGYKVSTYATNWILQSLQRGIANSCSTVRLPVNVHGAVKKMQAIRGRLADDLGHEPSEEELAETLGWPIKQVRDYIVHERSSRDPLSLSMPLGNEGGDGTLEDFIADQSAPDVGLVDSLQLAERLNRLLDDILGERNADIVRRRFGLGGMRSQTIDEIARAYSITTERVRQTVRVAPARLRNAARESDMLDLSDYLVSLS